jgi:hypothetical protein
MWRKQSKPNWLYGKLCAHLQEASQRQKINSRIVSDGAAQIGTSRGIDAIGADWRGITWMY